MDFSFLDAAVCGFLDEVSVGCGLQKIWVVMERILRTFFFFFFEVVMEFFFFFLNSVRLW